MTVRRREAPCVDDINDTIVIVPPSHEAVVKKQSSWNSGCDIRYISLPLLSLLLSLLGLISNTFLMSLDLGGRLYWDAASTPD